MDKLLEEKLQDIVETAKKIEAVQKSIREKETALESMEIALKNVKGLPSVTDYASKSIEALRAEIAQENEQLNQLKAGLH